MKQVKLTDLLLKTIKFYVPNFGELTACQSDDEILFKNVDGYTKLKCPLNSIFEYTQDIVDGNDFIIFKTVRYDYKLFPVKRQYLKISE